MKKSQVRPPEEMGGVAALNAWYQEHGESPFVKALENMLTDEFRTTREIAVQANTSTNYAVKGLAYLALHGRAEREIRLSRGPGGGGWGYAWRRTQRVHKH